MKRKQGFEKPSSNPSKQMQNFHSQYVGGWLCILCIYIVSATSGESHSIAHNSKTFPVFTGVGGGWGGAGNNVVTQPGPKLELLI